ncbi:hypothetical protein Q3G72_022384 [Acer saccharum]|nr:hypothetical protein Q3G72_022384 [Acer saccharum]
MVKKGKSAATKKPCDSVMVKKRKSAATKHSVQKFLDQEIERLYHQLQEVTADRVKEQLRLEKLEFRLTEIGYIFSPEEGILVCHYLRRKILDEHSFYFIKEADVYGTHPLNLIENYPAAGAGNVWYFFTRSRPNEIQPGTSEGGHWICGKEMDILYQGNKVGVKQLLEYCEGGRKTEYKIDHYGLESPPDNLKNGPWFICKLYKDDSCEDVQS